MATPYLFSELGPLCTQVVVGPPHDNLVCLLKEEEVTVQTKAERSKKTHHYEKKDDIP